MPLVNIPKSSAIVLGGSSVAATLTGSTSETPLATVTIPAGAMGTNGILRIFHMWSMPGGGANDKIYRIRLGGISGTIFASSFVTTNLSFSGFIHIGNRGAANSQIGKPQFEWSFGESSSALMTGSVDTSAAQDLVLSGQLESGADTMYLEHYLVELIRP